MLTIQILCGSLAIVAELVAITGLIKMLKS